jgi:hypothetical protein
MTKRLCILVAALENEGVERNLGILGGENVVRGRLHLQTEWHRNR